MVLAASPAFQRPLAATQMECGSPAVRVFFHIVADRDVFVDAMNAVAWAKAQQVLEGNLDPDTFLNEVEGQTRKYGLTLTENWFRTIAELFDKRERPDKACDLYRKALAESPDNHEILNNLGVILSKLGRYEEAVQCLEQAKVLKPDFAKVYNNLALAYQGLRVPEKALTLLEEAIRRAPNYGAAIMNRAMALQDAGEHEPAVGDFHKALSLSEELAREHSKHVVGNAYLLLGISLSQLGRFEEALREFDQALKNDGDPAFSLLNKASVLEKLGRKEEGRQVLEAFDSLSSSRDLLKDPDLAAFVGHLRQELQGSSRLVDLVDSVEVDVPQDVDFADWDRLSSYLESTGE